MAMAAGGTGDYKSDINITPLVDVVLVLLIIFMVITPLLQMGYDVKVPPKATVDQPAPSLDQLIVSLTSQNRIFLNKSEVTPAQLTQQLGDILKNRASNNRTVFFSAEDGTAYGDCVRVMDLVRTSGASNLGIVLETVPIQ
ncbi:MAG TPA: biopolymer transporter ExbD [Thermoanaerobaculia bacterium]|jgi:biopolymer transport protein ExbD|nr:biopolymer transporter ExbD [Thermoanaerobaculia bacterium]